MTLKTALCIAILFVAAAVVAPVASADSIVLQVQGTDYSVNSFSNSANKLSLNLPLQLGSATLLLDVTTGAHLGTIDLEVFGAGNTLEETLSFTQAIATNFHLSSTLSGIPIDLVGFSYSMEKVTLPSGSNGTVPEPSSFALLGIGALCAAAVASRK